MRIHVYEEVSDEWADVCRSMDASATKVTNDIIIKLLSMSQDKRAKVLNEIFGITTRERERYNKN